MSDAGANVSEWKWDAKKERAALLLAQGVTYAAIEKEHGVSHTSLARWKKEPEFVARVDEIIEESVSEARRILRRNAAAAAQQLVHLHASGNAMHSVKLAASKDILDRCGLKAPEKIQQENSGNMVIRWEYGDTGTE